jgi:type VI secretion system protein VasD
VRLFTRRVASLLVLLAVAGCASGPKKPAEVRLALQASADTNPDAAGRPSPVVVRLYQLKNDAAFIAADFFAIYDNEQPTLAADLIGREEFTLAPGERRSVPLAVSPDAKFVGVIAAYRDVRGAEWRAVVPTPLRRDVTLSVERARVQFLPAR